MMKMPKKHDALMSKAFGSVFPSKPKVKKPTPSAKGKSRGAAKKYPY